MPGILAIILRRSGDAVPGGISHGFMCRPFHISAGRRKQTCETSVSMCKRSKGRFGRKTLHPHSPAGQEQQGGHGKGDPFEVLDNCPVVDRRRGAGQKHQSQREDHGRSLDLDVVHQRESKEWHRRSDNADQRVAPAGPARRPTIGKVRTATSPTTCNPASCDFDQPNAVMRCTPGYPRLSCL